MYVCFIIVLNQSATWTVQLDMTILPAIAEKLLSLYIYFLMLLVVLNLNFHFKKVFYPKPPKKLNLINDSWCRETNAFIRNHGCNLDKTTRDDIQKGCYCTPPKLQTPRKVYKIAYIIYYCSIYLKHLRTGSKDQENSQDATWMGHTMGHPLLWTLHRQHWYCTLTWWNVLQYLCNIHHILHH